MLRVYDLAVNDTLVCWMKSGAPLRLEREATGRRLYKVASRIPARLNSNHFTNFHASVIKNFPAEKLLHLRVTPIRNTKQTPVGEGLEAFIHYSTFKRIDKISDISYPGRVYVPFDRNTNNTTISGSAFSPYRTATAVSLQ